MRNRFETRYVRLLAIGGVFLILATAPHSNRAATPSIVVQKSLTVPAGASPAQKYKVAREAAEARDPAGLTLLGECYRNGWGCNRNPKVALDLFLMAASNGYHRAEMNAANLALEMRNFSVARKWYSVAAKRGDADAQFCLGNLYDANFKIPGSLSLFKVHLVPNYRTLDWFIDGPNGTRVRVYAVPVDYTEASRWYKKAAAQGNKYAQNNLGVMYAYGLGVRADLAEAHKWLQFSARQSKPDEYPISHNLRALSERMTSRQLEEANRRARS